jgi:tripartite-type tricarboxylate transporter receptor subunit TctC
LGEPVTVTNRVGGGGAIGLQSVIQGGTDGDTLLVATFAQMVLLPKHSQLPFDPSAALTEVAVLGTTPYALVVPANSRYSSVRDLMAASGVTYGSNGTGSVGEFFGEMISQGAHGTHVHVPYKGTGPMTTDLLAGQVDYAFASVGEILTRISSGQLKVLGVTGPDAVSNIPGGNTLASQGFPQFAQPVYYSVFVKRGVADARIDQLRKAILRVVSSPEFETSASRLGVFAARSSNEAVGATSLRCAPTLSAQGANGPIQIDVRAIVAKEGGLDKAKAAVEKRMQASPGNSAFQALAQHLAGC